MNRRSQLTLLAAAAVLLAVGSLFLVLNRPGPPQPKLINVTRDDYNKALARWNAQGITEYVAATHEVTASSDCPAGAKVVAGKTVQVNGEENCRGRNRYSSVEELFDAVHKRLTVEESSNQGDRLTNWQVEFHPEMGYPRRLAIEAAPGATPPPGKIILTSTTTVKDITIRKTSTAGTPSAPGTTATPQIP